MVQYIHYVSEPFSFNRNVHHIADRENRNDRCKQDDQHDTGPEHRCRIADKGEHRDKMTGYAIGLASSNYTEHHAEKNRHDLGTDDQQQRRRHLLQNERGDRLVVIERITQVQPSYTREIFHHLMPQRKIETVVFTNLRHHLRVQTACILGNGVCNVAGRQVHQHEVED